MDPFQPLQLKGEVMDLEFTIDTDHRKRRRNRTTQSCLNCHTSKRKCDRKRPCQRCIQLGLTGLCVYEIDDPALRDDPSVDETTRLRNRIAELESLVRELRGTPANPTPAGPTAPSETATPTKNGTRAQPNAPPYPPNAAPPPHPSKPRLHQTPGRAPPTQRERGDSTRFTPSPPAPPPASMRYHQNLEYNGTGGAGSYHSSPGSGSGYSGNGMGMGTRMRVGEGSTLGEEEAGTGAAEEAEHSHAYMGLSHQLQSTLSALRQSNEADAGTYDSNTPTDSEILTPLSASSSTHGGPPFHNSSPPGGVSPHEWNTMSTPNYNPYFPMQSNEHGGMYNHIIT
ncbi:uncharacterized protein EV420DRAFT_1619424 [Desarmillaria tabescens]|uniref:Zn(2)-C6 fungal-type domain-containing protein n=1 Tax=Armillaria tabescens TaxID=1929756 RepID=A0AA39TS86_ARMTA|nr:uncharacterized protein EV420DRAFT_1619424 [Desarmillaria tabescens]KAK0462059.1 hypothetical protein EV420DRAFT_1619424 [Desarmillaria tabescens]